MQELVMSRFVSTELHGRTGFCYGKKFL